MNSKTTRPGGSIRTSSRSLRALMYAATPGIAIVGAVSMSLTAQAQESHCSVARRGDVSRCPPVEQTSARTLANAVLEPQRNTPLPSSSEARA